MSTSVSATVDTILHTEAAPQLLLVLVARDPLQVAAAEAICPASIWAGLGWAGLGRNINLPQHTTHDAQPGPCMTRPCRENKCNPKLQIFFILLDILSGPSLSLCVLVIHNTCTLGGDRGTWTVWKFLKEGLHLHNMMQKPRDNLFLTLPMNICIALFTVYCL